MSEHGYINKFTIYLFFY